MSRLEATASREISLEVRRVLNYHWCVKTRATPLQFLRIAQSSDSTISSQSSSSTYLCMEPITSGYSISRMGWNWLVNSTQILRYVLSRIQNPIRRSTCWVLRREGIKLGRPQPEGMGLWRSWSLGDWFWCSVVSTLSIHWILKNLSSCHLQLNF